MRRLKAALRERNIVLPALDVDLYGRPLVELGRCTVETARKLTAALSEETAE
ncbi:hypothetical protein [Streptomyces sp. URMC 129]|uniref:hypothetical protein n=1 Tax=Streptomyces sp. URMC 129 TaxID=3423407 RepID=UPI003F1D4C29